MVPATLPADPAVPTIQGWLLVEHLPARFGGWPPGAWPEPPTWALLLPLLTAPISRIASFRQTLDVAYQAFFA